VYVAPQWPCTGVSWSGDTKLLERAVLQASEDTVMVGAVLVGLVVSGVGENPRAGLSAQNKSEAGGVGIPPNFVLGGRGGGRLRA
jgi:hypothetical protein